MISVILASHNGAATLPLTLKALKEVKVPDGGFEIIAVDNASSDGTRGLLAQYEAALPLTVIAEPRKGKSFALNRALGLATGELIVFADDDVLPFEGWLVAFQDGAARYPEVDLFAGQVRHFWQKKPPAWLRRLAEEGRSYGGTPAGQPEGPVAAIFFKGANFMIRRSAVAALRFSERPGANFTGGASSGGGEDTAFVRAALVRGHKACYLPDACLQHIVRPHQVGIVPVIRRYVRIGRAMTINDPAQFEARGRRLFGYPRYLFRTLPRDVLRALGYWVSGNSYAAADLLIGVAMTCGRAQEWRRIGRAEQPRPRAGSRPYGGPG